MSEKRGADKVDEAGLTQISVYVPDPLLAKLRNQAKKNRRSLSAEVVLWLELYDSDPTLETARELRAALDREGYSAP